MTELATPSPHPDHSNSFATWRDHVRRPTPIRSAILLAGVVGVAALLMLLARRTGHWWGDDWALYVRQADGLLHADAGRVAAENRFTLDASVGPPFSPPVYPWGFPLVLTPFVAAFGDDLDRIALVSTLAACVFACAWYTLARPRIGEPAALLGAFAVVTTPLVLLWAELIQSEWTFVAVVGVVFVGLDRVIASDGFTDTRQSLLPLVWLGLGAAVAFSVRREGFALTPAIATAQLVALHAGGSWRDRLRGNDGRRLLGRLLVPHAAALGVVLVVLIALPSTLVPSYEGTSLTNVVRFADQHVEHLAEVSGLKSPWNADPSVFGSALAGWVSIGVYLVASLAGIALALTMNRRRDAQFVTYVVVALIIGGSFRSALNRYVASIGPLLLLLGMVALVGVARRLELRVGRRGLRPLIVLPPLALLAAGNVAHAVDRIDATNEFESAGRIEWGPMHPDAQAMYDQVLARTDADAIVGAPKARAMTWATGRRSVQVGGSWQLPSAVDIDAVVLESDDARRDDVEANGAWELTWQGRRFVLYQRTDG